MTPALISDLPLCNTVFVNSVVKWFQSRNNRIWLKRLKEILFKTGNIFLKYFFGMCLVILAVKKERKICLWSATQFYDRCTLFSFCVGGLAPFKEFSLIMKGSLASCVWSLKLCPKGEMIFLFATSASRCGTTSNLFSPFNDFTAHYMHRHVLPYSKANRNSTRGL